ncbi:uncharacterized protein P884DRAFT_219084 [Thermothelomyces heterothallicus CBS 202.75]|uniref:uncharacterized protein n=1 Tax=Thermothelomyces heterothallicus CBS 202.75 TaxID=1149848 RepID=UPI003743C25A
MPSKHSPRAVIFQGSSRPSTYRAPGSTCTTLSSPHSPTIFSMDSSNASRSTIEARYRTGSSDTFYVDVKEIKNPRGGPNTVIVQQYRPNPDKDEPRSSDRYSDGYYSKK